MRARGRLARRVQMEKKHPPDNSFMVARAIRYLQRAEAVTHPDVPPLTIP